MTDHFVSDQRQKNILSDITNKYYNIFIDKLRLVEEAKKEYQMKDSAYQHAADETKAAEQAAEEARSVFQMAEEITLALMAKEKEMPAGASLPGEPFSYGIPASNTNREAVNIKSEARVNAEKAQAYLNLALAMATLKAGMNAVSQAQANALRIDAENRMHISDAVSKISFAQLEILHYFDSAREIEEMMETLIAEQHEAVRDVEAMRDPAPFIDNIYNELREKLSVTGNDLIPYEDAIAATAELEREAEKAYKQALDEVEAAHSLEMEKRDEADNQENDIQAIYDFTEKEYQRIVDQCLAALKSAKDGIEAMKEECAQKWEHARISEKAVIDAQREIAEKNLQKSKLESSIFEAISAKNMLVRRPPGADTTNSADNTGRNDMGPNNAPGEMQLGKDIEEKTVELAKITSRIKELVDNTDQLIQTASAAKEAAISKDKFLTTTEADYSHLEGEMEKRKKLAKEALDRLCAASADKAKISRKAEEESREATHQLINRATKLELELEQKKKARIKAEEARDAAKSKINNYIEEIQNDAFHDIDKYEAEILSLWQKSESLRLAVKERGSEIEHFLATSRQASEKESQCIDELKQVIEKAGDRLKAAQLKTASLIKQVQPRLLEINNAVTEIKRLANPQGADALVNDASQLVVSFNALSEKVAHAIDDAPYKPDYALLHIPELSELNLGEPITADQPFFDTQAMKESVIARIRQLINEGSKTKAQKVSEEIAGYGATLVVKEAPLTPPAEKNEPTLHPQPSVTADESTATTEQFSRNFYQRYIEMEESPVTAATEDIEPLLPNALNELIGEERNEAISKAIRDAVSIELSTMETPAQEIDPPELSMRNKEEKQAEKQAFSPLESVHDHAPEMTPENDLMREFTWSYFLKNPKPEPEEIPSGIKGESPKIATYGETETQAETSKPTAPRITIKAEPIFEPDAYYPSDALNEIEAESDLIIEPEPESELSKFTWTYLQKRITPEFQETESTSPEDALPEDEAAEPVLSEEAPFQYGASENAPFQYGTSEDAAAEDKLAEPVSSENMPSQYGAFKDAPPEDMPPRYEASEDISPDEAAPEYELSEIASSEDASPEYELSEIASFEDASPEYELSETIEPEEAEAEPENESVASTSAINETEAQQVTKPLNKQSKKRLRLFGKKNKDKSENASDETENSVVETVAIDTAESTVKSKAEIEAARISAEIESMRRELASVTFGQRKEQEALEAVRKKEQAEKRRLAEEESARIRAIEEEAQKVAEEEEAIKMEEQRIAALEAERIAQSLAVAAAQFEEKEESPSDTQRPQPKNNTPAYFEDDDDSDMEIELRRLIISDFNKNK